MQTHRQTRPVPSPAFNHERNEPAQLQNRLVPELDDSYVIDSLLKDENRVINTFMTGSSDSAVVKFSTR